MSEDAAESPKARASFGALVARGAAWKLGAQIVIQTGRIGFMLVLARLLTPSEFGLVAMALVVTGFVIAFADLGLGAALVQRQTIDERDRSTVFWVGLGVGALLTLLGVALSGPLAAFYDEPAVRGLTAALSLSFFITALGATQRALLTRDLNFRTLELATIAGVYVGGATGVACALSGVGAWSLVAQQLAIPTVTSLVLWLTSAWRPHMTVSLASLRSLGGYGGNVLGARLTYAVQESALPLIIGRALGPGALGVFSIAYLIVLAPLGRLAIPVGEVLFPAFARLQGDRERMASMWIRALRVLAALCVPAMAGLIVVAPDVIPLVLGEQWVDAVPVVQILALVGLLQALSAWHGAILLGVGRARTLFRATSAFLVVYVVAFVVGVQWGLLGTAVAYLTASIGVEIVYLSLTTRALGVPFALPILAMGGIVRGTIAMVMVIGGLRIALAETVLSDALIAVVLVAVGSVAYAIAITWQAPAVVAEVRALLRRHARAE